MLYINSLVFVLAAIIVLGLMALAGVINATMTIASTILHVRTITRAEAAMGRAQRIGDGPAYEYARQDKAYAVNSLIGSMTELAAWPIVGLDPRIAVRSLREQVKDGCRIPVRW